MAVQQAIANQQVVNRLITALVVGPKESLEVQVSSLSQAAKKKNA